MVPKTAGTMVSIPAEIPLQERSDFPPDVKTWELVSTLGRDVRRPLRKSSVVNETETEAFQDLRFNTNSRLSTKGPKTAAGIERIRYRPSLSMADYSTRAKAERTA